MRRIAVVFYALGLVHAAFSATPGEEFTAQWTRERAIKYFEENTGNPPHDIEVEVDRYIVWPSQALDYKIGQLKIQELRTYAEKELLETHLKEWVAKRKTS